MPWHSTPKNKARSSLGIEDKSYGNYVTGVQAKPALPQPNRFHLAMTQAPFVLGVQKEFSHRLNRSRSLSRFLAGGRYPH